MEIVGLSREKIEKISKIKNEEDYFKNYRLKSYEIFKNIEDPKFGVKYDIDFDKIIYYKSNEDKVSNDWNKISCSIKNEFQIMMLRRK